MSFHLLHSHCGGLGFADNAGAPAAVLLLVEDLGARRVVTARRVVIVLVEQAGRVECTEQAEEVVLAEYTEQAGEAERVEHTEQAERVERTAQAEEIVSVEHIEQTGPIAQSVVALQPVVTG